MTPLEALPRDTQQRIADLSERRQHSDSMQFTKADAEELAAWELYLSDLKNEAAS